MTVSDKFDSARAEGLARDALAWMAQRGVPPSPHNFEVVVAYLGGDSPALKLTVEGLIAQDCKFDPATMSSLHAQYFRFPKESEELTELSGKISSELGSLVKLLHTAGRDQSAYGTALSKASGELDRPDLSEDRIKTLID